MSRPVEVIGTLTGRTTCSSWPLLLLLLPSLSRCQVFMEREPLWSQDGLDQESSCYFQPFYKQLTCKCPLGQVAFQGDPLSRKRTLRTTLPWLWGWSTSSGRPGMRWRLVSFMEDNWQHKSVIKTPKLGHHHLMNQVRQVLVQSCSNLRLGLDLVIKSTILPTCFNQANAAKTFQHRNTI